MTQPNWRLRKERQERLWRNAPKITDPPPPKPAPVTQLRPDNVILLRPRRRPDDAA